MVSIKGIMHRHLIAVHNDASVSSAVKLMKQARISALPVLRSKGRTNELMGVLTREEAEREPLEKKVGEMKLHMLFVELNDKPDRAAKLMVENKISRLPVVNSTSDMRCVGVVTSTEIARNHKKRIL